MGNCSPEDIHNKILKFETHHDLFRFKRGDWCVWPLFRFRLSLAFYQLPLSQRKRPGLGHFLRLFCRDILALFTLSPAPCVAVSFSSARADRVNGKAKDIFFDDIGGLLPGFFKIEKPNNPRFFFKKNEVVSQSQFSGVLFRILAMGYSFWPFHGTTKRMADALRQLIRQEMAVEFLSSSQIYRRIQMFHAQRVLYAWLFRRLKSKVLLSADGYGDFDFFAAAKQCGMATIELQHGFVDRFHCGYSWGGNACAHHAAMPVADTIFSFGETWRAELESGGFWRGKVRVIGNVWLDQYRAKREGFVRKAADSEVCVVVTTQGIDTPGVIQFFQETLRSVHGKKNIKLIIKLHPILETSATEYAVLREEFENVEVFLGSEFPSTPELISNADLHCTISSTCHYDALALGVPTVILPLNSYEIVLNLEAEGYAKLVQSPKALAQMLLNLNERQVDPDKINRMYQRNALENMRKALKPFI